MNKEQKKLQDEELDKVNGGKAITPSNIQCPSCSQYFIKNGNSFTKGSGCDSETYWRCPYCGHEFK